ncbi:MAG: hypothetical protein AB9846_15655 [Tenuifilaceae bacterium]
MKINQFCKTLLVAIFTLTLSSFGYAQETISPTLQFQYFKNTDDQRSLKATLTYTESRNDVPLQNMEVVFYTGSKKEELAKVNTNEKGVALFNLPNDLVLPIDKDGVWYFSAEFAGKDSIEATTSDDISIVDFHLEMNLELIDSVKTILLKAYTINNSKAIPLADESINLYVKRMFSLLMVGDGTFDEEGNLSIEFPNDIPGDKDGHIEIVARIDEHPTYGTVDKRLSSDWGIPSRYQPPTTHRALWTKGAPTWMIVALTIMLTGVWGHYLYAIICLIRIKRSSKEEEKIA